MADDILKNIPLPADLPENWTSGQIIAPTGAEAGLDEQHGYNYLMKQVNNAQKALKALAAQREEDLARIKFWASNDPTSPASFIGGTWERIEGKFIMGASDTYPAGSTGGSATHTHLMPIGWDRGNIFYAMNAGLGPFYGDQIVNGTESLLIKTTSSPSGDSSTARLATTKSSDTLPPYYSMYIWRRVT